MRWRAQTGSGRQPVLARPLGSAENVEAEVEEHPTRDGDTFLLCSDALSRMVPDDAIAPAIDESLGLQAASDRLIELANRAGGEDNVTAVLFRAKPEARGWFQRVWR